MNERIKLFAKDFSTIRNDPWKNKDESVKTFYTFQEVNLEKFAELVAKYVVKRVADLGAIDVNGEIAKTVIQEFSVPL